MNQRSAQRGFTALLVTQFFGAFNDNIFKFVVSVIAVDYLSTAYLSASSVVFVLPFLLFSTYAGYLADRFSKKTIIVVVRAFELVVMTMALIAFLRQDVGLMFVVLFCKGAQSAVFSPSKYGILPEILEPRRLSEGNGMLVLWTWVAIILGEALGGPLMKLIAPNFHLAAYCFLAIAVLGLGASLFIPSVEPVRSQRPWKWNFLGEIWANLKWIRKDRAIFLSMIGLAYFNVLAGLFHLNILVYTRQLMGTGYFETGALMACLAIGIGLGSVAAGKLSDRKIELGLVPLGAAGLSVFCFSLGGAYHSFPAVVVCLFLLGTFCGFYIVPLNALIQQKSPHQQRGQVLGTNNFLCFVGLLLGSALLYLLSKVLGLNAAQIFVVTGAITLAGVVYITSLLPYAFVRFLVWLLAHTVYKIKAVNPQHVPDKGGALLVCNHVSLVDWLMLIVTIQRPIRFVMGRHVYESKPLHPLYKLIRAIPISHDDNPKEIVRSLQRAREIIKNGELVCIFAEGQITRTGNILKFNKGLEHIIKGTGCPIIPVHLDRIWGSIFSFEGGKFIHKMPKILPYPVTVSYGPPLPSDADAFEVRNRVLELGAEAFRYRLADRIPLPVAFWREARRHPFQFCIADSAGQRMNYALTMISAVALARRIKKNQAGEEKIGILLPPSVGGALANLAVAIAKKVPVNLNYTTSKDALASIVEQCRMKTVITSKTFLEKTGLSFSCKTVLIEDIVKSVQPVEKLAAAVKFFAFPKFLSRRLIFGPRNGWTIDSLATIMFTSGSTGTPKGVLLTHANITSNLEGLYEVFHTKDDDVILGVLPFFHSFGFTATLWFPLVCGIGAVYHFNPLDAKTVGKLAEQHKATIMMSTPTFLNMYILRCTPEQFKSLRVVVVGAEKLKEKIAQAFQEKFGVLPMEGYGCTELSPIVSINLPDFVDPAVNLVQKAHKPGRIGLPLPGIAVRILDQETLQPVGVEQKGVLHVKGPNVMQGYLNRPEDTSKVIRDGWYCTGDIATMDEDGFITITDRLSRFSKIGGEMVPHIKVEESIHAALNATEQVAVVTSVPDEKKGEKLVVLYKGDIDVEQLAGALQQTDLPKLWVPGKEMFFKIEAIPLLGSGKTDLSSVKKRAAELTQGK